MMHILGHIVQLSVTLSANTLILYLYYEMQNQNHHIYTPLVLLWTAETQNELPKLHVLTCIPGSSVGL